MICPNCGSNNPDNAQICVTCGALLAQNNLNANANVQQTPVPNGKFSSNVKNSKKGSFFSNAKALLITSIIELALILALVFALIFINTGSNTSNTAGSDNGYLSFNEIDSSISSSWEKDAVQACKDGLQERMKSDVKITNATNKGTLFVRQNGSSLSKTKTCQVFIIVEASYKYGSKDTPASFNFYVMSQPFDKSSDLKNIKFSFTDDIALDKDSLKRKLETGLGPAYTVEIAK